MNKISQENNIQFSNDKNDQLQLSIDKAKQSVLVTVESQGNSGTNPMSQLESMELLKHCLQIMQEKVVGNIEVATHVRVDNKFISSNGVMFDLSTLATCDESMYKLSCGICDAINHAFHK